MATKGKFIVFEGCDGSGKSTQLKLLANYLESKGEEVYLTREPTDSPFGSLIHTCLTGRISADEHTIAAMFAADRLDHIRNGLNGILKKLDEGVTVLCDRFYLSSFAYNGGFVPLEWVISLNMPAMEAVTPDLTVFIDLPPEEGMQRVSRRGDKERYETLEKQKLIRENYFALFERFKAREKVAVVRSEKDKETTQANIRKIVDGVFGF